jgi:hypothetical protein
MGLHHKKFTQFHVMVEEALNKFFDNMERENLELKQKIKELGATLMQDLYIQIPLIQLSQHLC